MKRFGATVVALGTLAFVGYAAYRVLLSDQARENLRSCGQAVSDACSKVCDTVNEMYGVVVEDDFPNRERTEKQWEALGF